MTEALQHVQARNEAWAAGDARTAWGENQVLERYFAVVLDTPSYVSKTGHRWSADQRADGERRAAAAPDRPFESRAFPYPIFVVSPIGVWIGALALAAALWIAGEWVAARETEGPAAAAV
jgi:hypothetical protein